MKTNKMQLSNTVLLNLPIFGKLLIIEKTGY